MLFLLIGWLYNKVKFNLSFLPSAFRLFDRQRTMLNAGAFCLQFAFNVVSFFRPLLRCLHIHLGTPPSDERDARRKVLSELFQLHRRLGA